VLGQDGADLRELARLCEGQTITFAGLHWEVKSQHSPTIADHAPPASTTSSARKSILPVRTAAIREPSNAKPVTSVFHSNLAPARAACCRSQAGIAPEAGGNPSEVDPRRHPLLLGVKGREFLAIQHLRGTPSSLARAATALPHRGCAAFANHHRPFFTKPKTLSESAASSSKLARLPGSGRAALARCAGRAPP